MSTKQNKAVCEGGFPSTNLSVTLSTPSAILPSGSSIPLNPGGSLNLTCRGSGDHISLKLIRTADYAVLALGLERVEVLVEGRQENLGRYECVIKSVIHPTRYSVLVHSILLREEGSQELMGRDKGLIRAFALYEDWGRYALRSQYAVPPGSRLQDSSNLGNLPYLTLFGRTLLGR